MTLLEIAQIYTDLVVTENQVPENEHIAKEEINLLRSKYHQFLMDKLREEGVEFSDRFEAMNIAFQIIKSPNHSFQRTDPTAARR
jgi:flavin-dependent dehydrogenase